MHLNKLKNNEVTSRVIGREWKWNGQLIQQIMKGIVVSAIQSSMVLLGFKS
jgi:hypothetical protein